VASPVKRLAGERALRLMQPATLRSDERSALTAIPVDVLAVAPTD